MISTPKMVADLINTEIIPQLRKRRLGWEYAPNIGAIVGNKHARIGIQLYWLYYDLLKEHYDTTTD